VPHSVRHGVEMSVSRLERLSYPPLARRPGARRWQRIRLALIARWHAPGLDRELAAGASPSADALLAIRAGQLTTRRNRARTAAGLARAVRDARASRSFSAAVPPNRREVLAALTVLSALDRRLHGGEPVTAQGMALLLDLLTDGDSPLYRPREPGALGSRLRAAAAALEPAARQNPVHAGREAVG
jgi:hypothetical protein